MRRTFICAPLCLAMGVASSGVLAGTWSSLWFTPEQHAQRLLDAGHPQEAAEIFKDPRRRAYAELRAGHYTEAARLLKPLPDEESQYNRGNALARAGDLPSALAAYDAALKQAPGDRDARHNRDLVARELEQNSTQSSQNGGSQQQKGGGQPGSEGSKRAGQSKGPGGQSASDAQSQTTASGQAGSSPADSTTPGQDADQARQDATLAARLKRNAAPESSHPSVGGTGTARGSESEADIAARGKAQGKAQSEADWPPPKSEQTLALEQWLRRIPDDPGGLLRRKFLIEHIERQQAEQSQGQDAGQ
ncbi:MAG: tetratricopeptide repeat protein [Steroidobacteraceae bacterium]